jgi:hypothetical protein
LAGSIDDEAGVARRHLGITETGWPPGQDARDLEQGHGPEVGKESVGLTVGDQ